MAYEFQKLSEVETLTEVPEGASVLAEVNGDIKRIPSTGLGGSDIKTAIIKSSDYDDTLANSQLDERAGLEVTYECINMTFEDAYEAMSIGEPLCAITMRAIDGLCYVERVLATSFAGTAAFGVPCIALQINYDEVLYWSADGVSIYMPSDK